MPPSTQLASIWSRLLARILDGLIPLGLIIIFAFPALLNPDQEVPPYFVLFPVLIVAYVVVQIVLLSTKGQTIGKKCMHIRIVTLHTQENAGFMANVMMRGFLNGLIGAIPFYVLVDDLFIFRKDRRCIHDFLANTEVIDA